MISGWGAAGCEEPSLQGFLWNCVAAAAYIWSIYNPNPHSCPGPQLLPLSELRGPWERGSVLLGARLVWGSGMPLQLPDAFIS